MFSDANAGLRDHNVCVCPSAVTERYSTNETSH